jgi:hypothetical protein
VWQNLHCSRQGGEQIRKVQFAAVLELTYVRLCVRIRLSGWALYLRP